MPVYFVRHLPPKEVGEGEITFAVSMSDWPEEEVGGILEHLRKTYPGKFKKPGFYHLLVSMKQYTTVEEGKS